MARFHEKSPARTRKAFLVDKVIELSNLELLKNLAEVIDLLTKR
jgi:hypothetical protein